MKLQINKTYILGIAAFCGLFTACSKENPTLFGGESDGFYFNYDNKDDLTSTINFADSVVKEPAVGYVPIKIRLLGHLSDQVTPITLKAEPVDGYDEAQVTLPKVELKAGEYDTTVNVTVARPAQEGKVYAVKVSFEQSDKSVKDFDSFVIYSTESYEQPSGWDDAIYGEWNVDKFKFIAKTLQNAKFCEAESYTQSNSYNPTLINAVRTWHKDNPMEAIPYDIPFLGGDLYYGAYDKPDYWGDMQDKYFGNYDEYGFGTFANSLGLNTKNEEQVLGSHDENILKEANKNAVRLMMTNYNNQFVQGYNYWGLNSAFSVPMVDGIDYDIVTPSWWTNAQTKPFIEKYYGAYSEQKYKKMLSIAKREVGSDFKLFLLFPVKLTWDDASMTNIAEWDSDANLNWQYYGEQVIYEFYKMFKAEEPNLFPDNVPEPVGGSDAKYARKRK